MLLWRTLISFVVLAGGAGSITAQSVSFPEEIIERFDDSSLVIYINESDIEKAPQWSGFESAPPLSIEKVLHIANEYAEQHGLAMFKVDKIELKRVLHHEEQLRWYYLVEITNQKDGNMEKHYLAVLMDGKVLPAIREPESYK